MEKQFFRDNTEFMAKLETEPEFVALFRPPRFGKTFFAMMLANYYCVKTRGVEWERRFGGTSIHASPTKEQGTYLVLSLDFSIDIDANVAMMKRYFFDKINDSVRDFKKKYAVELGSNDISVNPDNANSSLHSLAAQVEASGYSLYVIIDEYDRFANKLLFEGYAEAYTAAVSGKPNDPQSSMFRSFLETIKAASKGDLKMRVFLTGISPMALADASGGNYFTHLTHKRAFDDVVGVREEDLKSVLGRMLLDANGKEDHVEVARHLKIMREWYDGYRFTQDSARNGVYNTTLVLHYLRALAEGLPCNTGDVRSMLDSNTEVSENIFRLAAQNPKIDEIMACLTSGIDRDIKLQHVFRLGDLANMGAQSADYLLSFLFHHGAVTFAERGEVVRIPNRVVVHQFFNRLKELTGEGFLWKFLATGDAQDLESALSKYLRSLPSRYTGTQNETALMNVLHTFAVVVGTKAELEKRIEAGEGSRSLFVDIVLHGGPDPRVLEVGVLPLHLLSPSSLGERGFGENKDQWKEKFVNNLDSRTKERVESRIRALADSGKLKGMALSEQGQKNYLKWKCKTVGDVVALKRGQLAEYVTRLPESLSTSTAHVVVGVGVSGVVVEEVEKMHD